MPHDFQPILDYAFTIEGPMLRGKEF